MKYTLILTLSLLAISCTKTITRTENVTHNTTDTLNVVMHDTLSNYPEPTDTGLIYLVIDSIPGFQLDSICIQDINTDQVYTYRPEYIGNSWMIHPLTPMLTCITFYYEWIEPYNVTIDMYTFNYTLGWTLYPKNYSPNGGLHYSENTFRFVDISKVFTITFTNH